MVEKKLRFWFMKEEKRKRTPKVSTPKVVIKETKKKKSPPRLVDETLIPPTDMIKEGTDLLKMSFAEYDKLSTAQGAQVEQDTTRTAENVEAGGENVEKTFIEGEVHTDSSATESDDIYPTMIAPTTCVSGKQKLKKSPKKKKASDEEDATYEPTPTEKEKIKKRGIKKRKARPIGDVPRRVRARKDSTTIPQKETTEDLEFERVEKVDSPEIEITGVRKSTPSPSPINKTIHIPDDREKTPEQRLRLLKILHLQQRSLQLHKLQVMDFLSKVSILEKGKAKVEAELKETKEKLGDIEAENVALREEVEQQSEVIEGLVDKIMEVNAQYKSFDGSNKTLYEMYADLHTSSSSENEVLKKEVEALRADKVIKDEQLNMLYTVIKHKLGINVQAVFDEIEIQRVEAWRVEREKQLAEEAKEKKKGLVVDTEEILGSSSQQDQSKPDDEVHASNIETFTINDVEMNDVEVEANVEISLDIVPVGEVKDVLHSERASHQQIKVERRRLRAKMNKFKVVEEDKEIDELFGDEDEEDEDDGDKDEKNDKDKEGDKDDKGDDDDDQGASGLLITKRSGPSNLEDFLNDELNEQQEDQHHEVSSSGTKHAGDEVFLTLPKVIYLHHAEEEGELDENRTRESMLEELDLKDGKLKFDIEQEIPPTPDREYTFKFMNEADNFHDVIIEDGSDDSEEDTPFHYSGVDDDFPTLNELFQSHNEDEVRRKVVEKIATEGVPETVSKEDLLEERKRWFKVMPKERKNSRGHYSSLLIILINL
ncbi:glutamic acid-rich protein-like [Helianthus annuus]|uniref:glutamic acid-rich protein-like n=1 Tax=Helianthus annuus TaxID=4232 RepID=UPI000B8F0967|nr:glutamic acid-rich protein-like [Helianthus annuus]